MFLRPMILCICWLAASLPALGQTIHWYRSLPEAEAKARETNKPLFVLSTGIGWCYACELLDRYVLKLPEFHQAMADRFVFVELTSERGDDAESQRKEKEHRAFMEKYICTLVPTAFLLDTNGKPIAIVSSFDDKAGVQGYIEKIDSALKARAERDELMKQAQSLAGLPRAELLDRVLKNMDAWLQGYPEHHDDALLFFFPETVAEILKATDSQGPIAQKYIDRQKYREQWHAEQKLYQPLWDLAEKGDYQAALKYIDDQLAQPQTAQAKERLERTKLSMLERSDQFEKALEFTRGQLARRDLSSEARDDYKDREITFVYLRLGRHEEGLDLLDKEIAEAGEDKARRRKWLRLKTQVLMHHGPVELSISARREYLALLEPKSDEWYDCNGLLSVELERAGQFEEALERAEVYLSNDGHPLVIMRAGDIAISLKKFDLARKYLNEAKDRLDALAKSERGAEREDAASLRPRLEKIRQRLEEVETNHNPKR